ncbi:MAG: AtpZ/AtpI family protein [Bacteroidales bacterium]|nr:AtpZ/AtpI family protein [Bacteroidales bacterium]
MKNSDLNNWAKYSTLGIELAVVVGASVFAGVRLDARSSSQVPWFTLLGVVFGLTCAMVRLWRLR